MTRPCRDLFRTPLLMILLAGDASAQSGVAAFGGSLVLPNYERIPMGEAEALESGAYIARTKDGNANWYNAAGLALAERTGVSASANAYEGAAIEFRALQVKSSVLRLSPFGGFFGLALAQPVTRSPNMRYGFYIARPISWDSGTIDFRAPINAEVQLGWRSSATYSRTEPGVALGFRVNDRLRVGAALGLAMTYLDENQEIDLQRLDADSLNTRQRSIAVDGSVWHMVPRAGLQWNAADHLRVGFVAASPGLQVHSSGKLAYAFGVAGPSRHLDETFRDKEVTFDLSLPFHVGLGVASVFDRGEVEVAVRHYGGSEAFDVLASDAVGQTVESVGGQPPVSTTFTLGAIRGEWRSVTNVSVGGNVALSERVRLHMGFQTDQSPVVHTDDPLFRRIDLVSGTAGVSFTTDHFGGTLGLGYSAGESDPVVSPPPGETAPVETRLRVSSFRAFYSVAARF